MAIILSIDTSTTVCSAAFHDDGELLANKELFTPQSAASQLAIQVDALFVETKISKKNISAVAVSAGPGSYTGLRIGASLAKGLCYGWGIPLIGIDSLLTMSSSIEDSIQADFLCPMIDARRMEVYCSLLDRSLNVFEKSHPKIIDETSFADQLKSHSILFFGDGAMKCKEVIQHPNAFFLENIYTSAASMGKLAFERFLKEQFDELALFEPNYLKDFVAKTKSV